MSLRGGGVIAIWNGIQDEGRWNFLQWHDREHMPERVSIPGFLAGRRYQAVLGSPEFFTLYETQGPQVLDGPEYLHRLNHPTEWTRRSVAFFTDVSRSLCEVRYSQAIADGGWVQTWRYEVQAQHRSAHAAGLSPRLEAIRQSPGVVGVHLCAANQAASGIQTEEKKGRPAARVPAWVLMVESSTEPSTAEGDAAGAQWELELRAAGAAGVIEYGCYRLQCMHFPPRTTSQPT